MSGKEGVNLGEVFPNFQADTTEGKIDFHQWIGNSWAVFFSHPSDYTPVCTTELGTVAKYWQRGEFQKRNVKVIALSCDPVESHKGWIKDIVSVNDLKGSFPYPIIADPTRDLAVRLKMIDPDEKDAAGLPLTARAVFVIGPDKKLKLSILYPATTGRNFDEILRAIDSLQLTANYSVATPANWQSGEACMIQPSVPHEDAVKKFPQGFKTVQVPSGKSYIRITPQPSSKL